jgi:hypothetical protein
MGIGEIMEIWEIREMFKSFIPIYPYTFIPFLINEIDNL